MGIQKFNLKDGTYIRFEKIGKGNPLMLFHTFRNRLEYGYPIAEKLTLNNGNNNDEKIINL